MENEILYRFFEGKTSYEEEVSIKQWMEASPENRSVFFEERKLFDAILLLGNRESIKEDNKKDKRKIFSVRELLKVAAIIAITLCGGYILQQIKIWNEPVAMQTISVPAGQRINLTLPDGTNIWVNAHSTIQYPVSFKKNKRFVILDGEAYFDVTKSSNPFIVQTKDCNIEVLGTKFNVEAYSQNSIFETSLFEGSVKVSPTLDPEASTIIKPNHKVKLESGKLHSSFIDDYSQYDWRMGLISFKDKSFAEIMSKFEKYFGLKIEIKNKKVLEYYYTGKFRQVDGIEYALRILQKDIGFVYERDDEKSTIYIK